MKSDDTYKVEVLKDPATSVEVLKDPVISVEVEVVEKNSPRELKLCLALDSVRRCLEGHMIKEKGFVENDLEKNIKISKFNSSDETGRFFLGVIEGNIDFKVLQCIILN